MGDAPTNTTGTDPSPGSGSTAGNTTNAPAVATEATTTPVAPGEDPLTAGVADADNTTTTDAAATDDASADAPAAGTAGGTADSTAAAASAAAAAPPAPKPETPEQKAQRLHKASCEGELDTVRTLLDEGISITWNTGLYSLTAIHGAASHNQVEVLELLHAAGVAGSDVHLVDRNTGNTPLMFAAEGGATEAVTWLLDHGCKEDITKVNWRGGIQPIHAVMRSDSLETLKVLVEKGGADVHTLSKKGSTPTHFAAYNGALKCLSWLVNEAGCYGDLFVENDQGHTPQQRAATAEKTKVAETLESYTKTLLMLGLSDSGSALATEGDGASDADAAGETKEGEATTEGESKEATPPQPPTAEQIAAAVAAAGQEGSARLAFLQDLPEEVAKDVSAML